METSSLLRDLMEVSGMSQSELARRSGMSRSLIRDYLHGTKQATVPQFQRLATAAGVRVSVTISPGPRPLNPRFIGVLGLGSALDRHPFTARRRLEFPAEVWHRRARSA